MITPNYPSWNFIGSKLSMIPWIMNQINELPFTTVLDLFGGTGIVSNEFRFNQKAVIYNDFLKHLQISAHGLLNASKADLLSSDLINSIFSKKTDKIYNSTLISFLRKYFFDDEVNFILQTYDNILSSKISKIQQELLLFALSQSMLKKRPFHTFHGSFLSMRLKKRNEAQTWDRNMKETMMESIKEINAFLNFLPDNLHSVKITGLNASESKPEMFETESIDLVYVDPPYISNKKKRTLKFANYVKNYQALEILVQQDKISSFINSRTIELQQEKFLPVEEMNLWLDQNQKNWLRSFENIIANFVDSTIVISYRSDSLITKNMITDILGSYKKVKFFATPHLYEKKSKEAKFEDYLFIAF